MIEIDIEKKIRNESGGIELNVKTAFQLNAITRLDGPSGIGKTTLLKMIAGLIRPDKGLIKFGNDVWFNGNQSYSKKVQERNIGFVFQDYALFPNMTVDEHLKFGTYDSDYIDELLLIGEMADLRKRLPKQLSGGQQQRLAILRALATKPSLLLMDEPFSALDTALKLRLIDKLKTLFTEKKITVVLVSHQESELDKNSFIFNLG